MYNTLFGSTYFLKNVKFEEYVCDHFAAYVFIHQLQVLPKCLNAAIGDVVSTALELFSAWLQQSMERDSEDPVSSLLLFEFSMGPDDHWNPDHQP